MRVETTAQVRSCADTGERGRTTYGPNGIAGIVRRPNEDGSDVHARTVGERASRNVPDAVEPAGHKLGDDFRARATCYHLEMRRDEDIPRLVVSVKKMASWQNPHRPRES